MGKGPEQTHLQGGHPKDPQTYERMLSIISHQRDEFKTTMRFHLTLVRLAIINKSTNKSAGEVVEKRKPQYTIGGNADWCSHCGKQYGISSKKLKMKLPFDPAIPLLGLYSKNPETPIQKHPCTQ